MEEGCETDLKPAPAIELMPRSAPGKDVPNTRGLDINCDAFVVAPYRTRD